MEDMDTGRDSLKKIHAVHSNKTEIVLLLAPFKGGCCSVNHYLLIPADKHIPYFAGDMLS